MDVGEAGNRLGIGTLLALEARAHRWPARTVSEAFGGLLVHDPVDPEPIFNRLVDPRLPGPGRPWDAWLSDVRSTFAAVGRRPHLWLTAPADDPRIARLERDGFGRVGASRYMHLADAGRFVDTEARALALAKEQRLDVERIDCSTRQRAAAARDVAAVLADAFELDPAFHVLIEADIARMLEIVAFGFVLVRLDGEPVAAARRTTDGQSSLLAAIGTRRGYRGRGLGRLVTASATRDALEAGSTTVFLGVEDGNDPARRLYEQLGYAFAEGGVTALLQR